MAFIIGNYNRYDYWDRAHSKYVFEINGNWYAIKEVELEWGIPKLPQYVDKENYAADYHLYDTYADAMQFVRTMKYIN